MPLDPWHALGVARARSPGRDMEAESMEKTPLHAGHPSVVAGAECAHDLMLEFADTEIDVAAMAVALTEHAPPGAEQLVVMHDLPEDGEPNYLVVIYADAVWTDEIKVLDLNDLLPPEQHYDPERVYRLAVGGY
jgi:hypothetical protein